MLLFSYAYRSLLARSRANAISVLSVALFVAGGMLGLAYYLSLRSMVLSVPSENIVVVAKGAFAEIDSNLNLESARKVLVLEGVKSEGGAPLAARELVSRVWVTKEGAGHYEQPILIRGIDDHSLKVHHITLLQGAPPRPGTLEVIIGRRVAQQHDYLTVGYELAMPAGPAKIVGIFGSDGGPFESEVWTPREALELHRNMKGSSSLTLVADSAARVPELVDKINASKDLACQAASVAQFRADGAGIDTIARTVLVLLIVLSVVATFAITTTMNAAVAIRIPELAALAAIGIRRGALGRIVLAEAVLLAGCGTIVGALASALAVRQLGYITIGNPVELAMSPIVLVAGIVLGLLVGVIGSIAPVIQVRRLGILEGLR